MMMLELIFVKSLTGILFFGGLLGG